MRWRRTYRVCRATARYDVDDGISPFYKHVTLWPNRRYYDLLVTCYACISLTPPVMTTGSSMTYSDDFRLVYTYTSDVAMTVMAVIIML